MIKLNGKTWKIFSIDTVNTVIDRISHSLGTIPEYLYIQDEQRILLDIADFVEKPLGTTKIDITAKSIVGIAKQQKNNDSPEKFIDKFPGTKIPQKELVKIWCAFNTNIQGNSIIAFAITENIAKLLGITSKDAEFLVKSSSGYDKLIDEKISIFNRKMGEYGEMAEKFNNIKGVERSDFKLDSSGYNIFVSGPGNINIMEIFNYFRTSEIIPFCSIRDYYKIFRGFKPSLDWAISLYNDILCKVSDKYSPKKSKDYKNVIISVEPHSLNEKNGKNPSASHLNGVIKINIQYNFDEKNIPRDEFINNIISSLKIPNLKIIDQKQDSLRGVASFPNQSINKYVFEDLVLNNDLYSKYLSINESVKATKKRSGMYMKYIHGQDELNITITDKILASSDKELKSYPLGTKYVRVKISSARDRTQIDNFFLIISKLLAFYNILSPEIIDFYRKWIPNFGKTETTKLKERNRLKDIAPEVFVSRYSKKCPLKEMPRIVDSEYVANLAREKWMLFPKTPEEGVQRLYVCDQNAKYIYPGLRKNVNLSNSEQFPFLPCCYVNNQQDKPNSNYTKYYSNTEKTPKLNVKEAKQQTVFLTSRTATSTGFGTLPENLQKLVNLVDIPQTQNGPSGNGGSLTGNFYRKGMSRNTGSFIECVLEALFEETRFLTIKKGQVFNDILRTDKTNILREKLSKWEYLAVGKQEMYDLSIQEISSVLTNFDQYIDPKKFARIIEEYFNCNILLFSGGESLDSESGTIGEMVLPRFSQAYLRYPWKKDRPFILVYENWGNYTEKLKYPQVELIIKTTGDSSGDSKYTFSPSDPVIKSLLDIYESLNTTWVLDKKIGNTILSFPFGITPISQYIDLYGKTRIINCRINDQMVSIETEPIPPLKLPLGELNNLPNNYSNITIPKKFGEVHVKLYKPDIVISPINLNAFNSYKKIAKYITEFFLWEFSLFISTRIDSNEKAEKMDLSNEMNKLIPEFVKNKVEIREDIMNGKNPVFPMNFSQEFFMRKNGKLILPDNETLSRLIYILRGHIARDPQYIGKYHTFTNFMNIYNEITDFLEFPEQILIKGENIIDEWILSVDRQNTITNRVLPEKMEPYFFSNKIISNHVFLAQNTDNVSSALEICDIWREKGYNPRNNQQENKGGDNELSFELWIYENSENIKPFNVSGKPTLSPINIIGYKYKGVPGFTVLLSL
jgi:hypothetical protein